MFWVKLWHLLGNQKYFQFIFSFLTILGQNWQKKLYVSELSDIAFWGTHTTHFGYDDFKKRQTFQLLVALSKNKF